MSKTAIDEKQQGFFDNGHMVVTGCTRSGKSNWIQHHLFRQIVELKNFKFVQVFTGTSFDSEYDYLPKKAVCAYSEQAVDQYIKNLERKYLQLREIGKEKLMPKSILLFDDCVGLFNRGDRMNKMITTVRHLNVTVIFSLQYLMGTVSTTFRAQIAWYVCLPTNDVKHLSALHVCIGNERKEEDFVRKFQALTKEPYTALVFNKIGYSKKKIAITKACPREQLPSKLVF